MASKTTLFVYGTLKRGCRNHGAVQGAEFAGEAATESAYLLVNCGSYPGLVRAGDEQTGKSIRGEVYRVDEELLAALDRFEDVPIEYVRESIKLADGSEAETYFYAPPFAGLEILDGEWRE
jgi:gamma-glutamylaminecyclotransferase